MKILKSLQWTKNCRQSSQLLVVAFTVLVRNLLGKSTTIQFTMKSRKKESVKSVGSRKRWRRRRQCKTTRIAYLFVWMPEITKMWCGLWMRPVNWIYTWLAWLKMQAIVRFETISSWRRVGHELYTSSSIVLVFLWHSWKPIRKK